MTLDGIIILEHNLEKQRVNAVNLLNYISIRIYSGLFRPTGTNLCSMKVGNVFIR